ncbi:acyltransferase family protein [Colwelliaceae bacterium BS250]
MEYRKDIDGLRAIAVLSVIFFHSGVTLFSGGFVGVDVFFVISGYLITSLVSNEIKEERFTFANFYKRRALRLLPALNVTLLIVLIFGFVFYNNSAFDNLGKEILFSALGLANILFAQGIDYFSNDEAYRPLIHLWSLGVEEQFYVFWPLILIFLLKFNHSFVLKSVLVLFFIFLWLSEYAIANESDGSYYYLQFRAFELLIGAVFALLPNRIDTRLNNIFSFIGVCFILTPMFLFDKYTNFPGVNALFPCLGTGLVIYFSRGTVISKLLGARLLVGVGLISYPLYLYHQPLISFLSYFELHLLPWTMVFIILAVCIPLSWGTYRFIEQPIRKKASKSVKHTRTSIVALVAFIPIFVISGALIAKGQGLPWRFSILNEFAYDLSEQNRMPFNEAFERGYQVEDGQRGNVLFIGDSVLQNYVVPLSNTFFKGKKIDVVSRGGCVLLKAVEFRDSFSDISCNDLREKLYEKDKLYDVVVISQSWALYDDNILNVNFAKNENENYNIQKWIRFLNETILHFKKYAKKIIVIGAHPKVHGTQELQPNILLTQKKYEKGLEKLSISNLTYLEESSSFFNKFNQSNKVVVLNPLKLWCQKTCITHNGSWSYFVDSQHVSFSSTNFLERQLQTNYANLIND